TFANNSVYNITTNSASAGTNATASLIGIYFAPTVTGNLLANNTVHSLSSTAATAAVHVTGIVYGGPTTTPSSNFVEKNLVHSLVLASSNGTATVTGINHLVGYAFVRNNMVRLGLNANGADITNGCVLIGINKASVTTSYIYHNSVYIGGSGVIGAAKTYAFRRPNVLFTTSTRDAIKNNIFVNNRSNGTGTGSHFAIGINLFTGLAADSCNYNLFQASGTGGFVGENVSAAVGSLAAWNSQTSPSMDNNSFYGPAGFINPNGDATSVDLHINPSTPTQVEANALPVANVTDDYDGDARVSPDLGADEGNFTPIDLTAPVITNPNFVNACSDMVYPVSVSITDLDAVSVAPGTAPRVYYKISTDVNAYNDNTSATAGWKYAVSTNTTSPFTFNIDFGLLNGGVQPNQTIQYFVVAQDNSGNVGVMPSGLSGTISSVAINAGNFPHTAPSTFSLLPCSGVVTVGTGGQYGVFTTANGIFNAINQAPALNGNLLIKVVSDITTEDGFVGLNQWNENGLGGYSITIESDANVLRSISGSSGTNAGLFRMSGADRVTFNGGAGSNKFLKFSNTGTLAGAATFNIINDSKYITVNNCIIEGGASSSTNGVVTIGTSSATGNDTITITKCDIKSYAANLPTYGVYGVGTTGRDNSGVIISNCNIYDVYSATIAPSAVYIGAGNSGWSIVSNKIYQTTARSNTGSLLYTGIRINNSTGGGFVIDGNYIGGADASGSGVSSYGSGSAQYAGIHFWAASSPVSSITGNTIKNISFTSISASTAAQGVFSGIYVASASGVNVLNNIVGANDVNGSINVTVSTNSGALVFGIRSESANTGQVSGNLVGGITATGTGTNNAIGMHGINLSGGVSAVANNNIGSATVANSMQINGTSTTNSSPFSGITVVASSSFFPSIRDN
ncbi:MAG: hypothetical protein JST49_16150, partial [Bacteroidetes bacterium]|nr:hypothetical protein [Bacteroidota bacterium]